MECQILARSAVYGSRPPSEPRIRPWNGWSPVREKLSALSGQRNAKAWTVWQSQHAVGRGGLSSVDHLIDLSRVGRLVIMGWVCSWGGKMADCGWLMRNPPRLWWSPRIIRKALARALAGRPAIFSFGEPSKHQAPRGRPKERIGTVSTSSAAFLKNMGQLTVRDEETVVLDIKFHTATAELSDNLFLMRSNDMLQPHLTFDWNFVRSPGMVVERKDKRMTGKHLAIVETIASGDARRTCLAMDSQIGGSGRRAHLGQP